MGRKQLRLTVFVLKYHLPQSRNNIIVITSPSLSMDLYFYPPINFILIWLSDNNNNNNKNGCWNHTLYQFDRERGHVDRAIINALYLDFPMGAEIDRNGYSLLILPFYSYVFTANLEIRGKYRVFWEVAFSKKRRGGRRGPAALSSTTLLP